MPTVPFTHDAFLDVFGRYNSRLWPAVVILWGITAAAAAIWWWRGRLGGRVTFSLLALHWIWSAVAYHWRFFRDIHPAAAGFALLFAAEAALFAWLAILDRGVVLTARSGWGVTGGLLVAYGLAYPFANLALGLEYPRVPVFAVPCPTTLITAGWLVASAGVPRWVSVIPLLWAVVGSSAAIALGIRADLALPVAAVALGVNVLKPPTVRG